MWWIVIVFSASQSIELCMLHCAIPTAAKYVTDFINLLKSIVVMTFGISVYTKLCIESYW